MNDRSPTSTVVTYLDMHAAPAGEPVPPPHDGLVVVRAERPTLAFYRFLYDGVGGDWTWTDRKVVDQAFLLAEIQDQGVHVNVLWDRGTPAGYAELDTREPGQVQLAYFGLMPEFIGRRYGRYLLDWAIRRAWSFGPERVWVHTCDLDHPNALPTYKKAGFVPYATDTQELGEERFAQS